jgi:hypothetical protein
MVYLSKPTNSIVERYKPRKKVVYGIKKKKKKE